MLSSSTLTRGSPKKPNWRPWCGRRPGSRTVALSMPRARGDARHLELRRWPARCADRGPTPDEVTMSDGICPLHRAILCSHLGPPPRATSVSASLRLGRTLVGAARGGCVVPAAGGRGPRMEVSGPGERLADECAADHAAVDRHQRPVGLAREEELGESGDHAGVDHAGEQAEHQRSARLRDGIAVESMVTPASARRGACR